MRFISVLIALCLSGFALGQLNADATSQDVLQSGHDAAAKATLKAVSGMGSVLLIVTVNADDSTIADSSVIKGRNLQELAEARLRANRVLLNDPQEMLALLKSTNRTPDEQSKLSALKRPAMLQIRISILKEPSGLFVYSVTFHLTVQGRTVRDPAVYASCTIWGDDKDVLGYAGTDRINSGLRDTIESTLDSFSNLWLKAHG